MTWNPLSSLMLILVTACIGIFLAHRLGKGRKHFSWAIYLSLVALPITSILYLARILGFDILWLFVACSLVGVCLEFATGFAYRLALKERLWTYHRWPIGAGYTSLLALPMWGIGGVMAWLIAQVLGL